LIAGQTLEGNRRFDVLAERCVVRGEQRRAAEYGSNP